MNSKFQSFYFIFLLLQMVSLEKHVAAFSSVNTLLYICELLLSGDYLSYIIPDIQSMNVWIKNDYSPFQNHHIPTRLSKFSKDVSSILSIAF